MNSRTYVYFLNIVLLAVGVSSPACLEVRSDDDPHDTSDTATDDDGCLQCHHQDGVEISDCDSCHVEHGVGPSHTAHLETEFLSVGIECEDCHPVPTNVVDDPHLNAQIDVLLIHPLATAGGLEPSFDGQACNDVYCHGATRDGGTFVPPVWDADFPDGLPCDACHGNPPSTPPHTPSTTDCALCHSAAFGDDGQPDPAVHIDGALESEK